MEKRLLDPGYRFRPPRPSRFWDRVLRPLRRWVSRGMYRVAELEVRGREHLDAAAGAGHGAVLAVNHAAHGDAFVIFEAMDRVGVGCCYMAAWQVMNGWLGLKGWAFQRLGAFSVDREGTDVRAFRAAVDVLQTDRSLVIFPEGDVYHLNDRITPLRDGAAMIALTAARRRERAGAPPLHIVPCGLKYWYLEDPTPELEALMSRLEQRVYWRPASDLPLPERIYRYAEAVLALKEIEHLGAAGTGTLPDRIGRLSEHVLAAMERRRLDTVFADTVPARVKRLRQDVLETITASDGEEGPRPGRPPVLDDAARRDLEELHLVTQLFSYPGDYLATRPTIERVSETLDKFEEDALGVEGVGPRAPRRAVLSFGPPIDVTVHMPARGAARAAAGDLTAAIERGVQTQLDVLAGDAAR